MAVKTRRLYADEDQGWEIRWNPSEPKSNVEYREWDSDGCAPTKDTIMYLTDWQKGPWYASNPPSAEDIYFWKMETLVKARNEMSRDKGKA